MRALGATDPRTVARYRLLGVLGGGGMGRVYLGQSPTGRRLAIKVIRSDLAEDPVFRKRFAREVAAVRAVSPLYTAAVVDADPDADPPWLATTFIEGPSLRDWVGEHGPLQSGAVLLLAAGLAEALTEIHEAGLVHRDLKPSNVLLDNAGPRIIDFGIAVRPDATRLTTSLVGTPSYLAPELVAGEEPGPASDVFSLGATLVFAATGTPLVSDGTMLQQLVQISTGRFDLSAVPRDLRPIIVRCLSRRPRDRPTGDELVQILVGAGVPAPQPGWYRARSAVPPASPRTLRLSRRRTLTLGGIVGVALAAGGAGVAAAFERSTPATRRGGTILWQAHSGTAGQGPVLVDGDTRIISATGARVSAVDRQGHSEWTRDLAGDSVALWQWTNAILATGTTGAWLLETSTGRPLLSVPTGAVRQVALSPTNAFLGLGTTTAAIDRFGHEIWRRPLGAPRAADRYRLAAGTLTGGTATVHLADPATGVPRWSIGYDVAPADPAAPPPDGDGPPPPPRDGPPHDGTPRDGQPPAGPPPGPDPAWLRSEARLGTDFLALRDVQDLRAVRLTDGGTVWHHRSPTPVAGIELAGDILVVAADRLTAYAVGTGTELWRAERRGARLAVSADAQTIVAAGERQVTAFDRAGGTRWTAPLPDTLAPARPDRVTVVDGTVYATYRPGPGRAAPDGVDVLAIAL